MIIKEKFMAIHNYITFVADFPDDAEWDDSGDLLTPGGKEILNFINSSISKQGLKCSDVEKHRFYGWSFEVESKDGIIWILLQYPGPWLLLLENKNSLFNRLFKLKSNRDYENVLKIIKDLLARDNRFSSIKYYTKEEYEMSFNK